MNDHPIGIFDSGYGGLTVMKDIIAVLPEYDYLYLGDNARAPYGTRSFDTVYKYTLQCVQWFFNKGCPLVILACNTASAKALRSIQQNDLPALGDNKRVLGVIRPTSEIIGAYTKSGHVGILGTPGTVQSGSYKIEIEKFYPEVTVTQEACPMWVPLIENNEHQLPGADYFIKKHLKNLLSIAPETDILLLACTHYPLLINKIREHIAPGIRIITQGQIVAGSLKKYLHNHSELELSLSKKSQRQYYTTGDPVDFNDHACQFFGKDIISTHIELP